MNVSSIVLSAKNKRLVESILEKIGGRKKKSELRTASLSAILKLLNADERNLFMHYTKIKASRFGFKGPYLGKVNVPRNLVAIRNQKRNIGGKIQKIETQYLPRPVFLAYRKLNKALYMETGKRLLVNSGYRSPAYQLIVFLRHLYSQKFNFAKTVTRVALPGYSEHGFPRRQGIDFATTSRTARSKKPFDFSKTVEYAWLLKNAGAFHFYESYPRGNDAGVIFEPWHWHVGDMRA